MPNGAIGVIALQAAPHIQAVFDRIDREMAACVRAAFTHHMLEAVSACVRPDGWSRGTTLERAGIADTSHEAVIAALRGKLALNCVIKRERPGCELARAHEWWLCGALIAEGRLQRATVRMAQRFAPNAERAA